MATKNKPQETQNPETLEAALAALEQERAAHAKTLEAFEDYKIDAEAKLLKEKAANPNKKVSVEIKGKNYLFQQAKVNVRGTILTAEEAAKDEEYLQSILSIEGQNILSEDN